jgi:hypothetical protein
LFASGLQATGFIEVQHRFVPDSPLAEPMSSCRHRRRTVVADTFAASLRDEGDLHDGSYRRAVVRHGIDAAAVSFLQKPFSRDTLCRELRRTLDDCILPTS